MEESLRPWQENGIGHILCKEPVPASGEHRPRPVRARTGSGQGEARPTPGPPVRQVSPPPRTGPGIPTAAPDVTQPELPPAYAAHLNRTTIPSFTLWTYWEFGEDLLGSPDPHRQALWRGMLKALHDRLGWPRGSIAFWPLTMIRDGNATPDLELFMYGVRRIKPVYLFCFGRKAFEVLLPNREYAAGRYTRDHLSIQVLPGPEEMLPDNKEAKGAAWKIFQRYTPG